MGDAAFGLLPDFIGGAVIVRAPVGIIGILVGVEVFVWIFRRKFAHFANRAIRPLARIGVNNFRTIRVQNTLALQRNVFRHA